LFAGQCQGCHIQSSWGGGVVLNTYDDVKKAAQNGRLYSSVAWEAGHYPMPKFGKQLPACFVLKISAWVNAGMPQ
jgi:mono/diheme cytochrome c family protein